MRTHNALDRRFPLNGSAVRCNQKCGQKTIFSQYMTSSKHYGFAIYIQNARRMQVMHPFRDDFCTVAEASLPRLESEASDEVDTGREWWAEFIGFNPAPLSLTLTRVFTHVSASSLDVARKMYCRSLISIRNSKP